MILLRKPSEEAIRAFLARQHDLGFSYAEVGATRSELPPGYVVDHSRIALGTGPAVYSAAVAAVRRCAMFRLRWVELHRRDAPIEAGLTVAVLAQAGLWWLNAARVVYTFDEAGPPRRFGFAYGTLPDHAERGAERFMVEEREADDSVWYDILAFSRPAVSDHTGVGAVGEVHVGVDEARQQRAAFQVDHLRARGHRQAHADRLDAAVLHQDHGVANGRAADPVDQRARAKGDQGAGEEADHRLACGDRTTS
jgi:uncharacterized protein (UPF0548 family)